MNNFRTIDGSANNPDNLGQTGADLRRLLTPAYENDGTFNDLPRGIIEGDEENPFIGPSNLPNPREISNAVSDQTESVTNYLDTSDWIWQWGQFLDHDLDLNEGGDEPFFIPIDPDDPLAPRIEGAKGASIVSVPTPGGEQQLLVVESDQELTLPFLDDTVAETISLDELVSSDEFIVTDEFVAELEEDLDINLTTEDSPTSGSVANDASTSEEDIPFITFTRIPDADESEPSRQYVNEITSFIDGSQVYGSEEERAEFLRANDGTGKLKSQIVNGEELLPQDEENSGLDNANPLRLDKNDLFIAGDARANEQVGLTSAHTLFVREHNRIAEEIANRIEQGDEALISLLEKSGLETGDFIYESARKVVGAQIQFITYNEYLPLLIGDSALADYSDYNSNINPSISLEFANVSFRLGHSQLSNEVQRLDSNGNSNGIALQDAFFDPQQVKENGVDSLLVGLPTQVAQEVDNLIVDGVRNFLFGAETGGFDLAAVNIQRGRDVGLPSYNDARRELGLTPATSFLTTDSEQGITSDPEIAERLASAYESIEDVDFWLGGISEDPVNNGLVGELFSVILTEQFTNLRDGDRFFYLNDSSDLAILAPDLEETTLSNIIQQNTAAEVVIQENAFLVPGLSVETNESASDANTIDFTVSLSDVSGAIVTVDYTTVDDVAIAGEDYVAQSGTLTFNPGEQTKTVSVSLLNDAVLQDNETFFLNLSNASNQNINLDSAVSIVAPTGEEIPGTRRDDLLNGNNGNDTIIGGKGNDTIFGSNGDDLLNGDRGADLIVGGNGNDTLDGGKNKDTLIGSNGDDLLNGDRGADLIEGGDGNDTLNGGKNSDTLVGGSGIDVYIINTQSGTDLVQDFELGQDVIGLGDGISFSELIITGEDDAFISYRHRTIGILSGISSESLTADQFDEL